MPDLAPTRATALASPLHQFTGWLLTVNCPGCRVLRTVEINTLILNRGGGAISVGEALLRTVRSRSNNGQGHRQQKSHHASDLRSEVLR